MTPELGALLDTIAGTEAQSYDVTYGNHRFRDMSDHPRIAVRIEKGPHRGDVSTAAGRYQMISRTWDRLKDRLNLPDFSPESQDRAAIALAEETYGPTLEQDLKSGDPLILSKIGHALRGQWTSLPGGIEARTTPGRFVAEYRRNLNKRTGPSWGERALSFVIPSAEASENPSGADWPAEILPAVSAQAKQPAQSIDWPDEILPSARPESEGPGTIQSGMRRGLEKQFLGAQQFGSDIGRMAAGELGQPYSEYRQGINERAQRMAAEDRQQGPMTRLGENVILPMTELAVLPSPAGLGPRLAVNAAAGGFLGAINPAETPAKRAENAALGGMVSMLYPEAFGAMSAIGRAAGPELLGIIAPTTGARMIASREAGRMPPTMLEQKPVTAREFGTGIHELPEGQMGPEIPHFGNVPGIEPTMGMIGGPTERYLEAVRRVQNPAHYTGRDEANKTIIWNELESRAPTRLESDTMRQELNAVTTPLREDALQTIRESGSMRDAALPLQNALDRFANTEGARSNTAAVSVANDLARMLERPDLGPLDLYAKRKQILGALKGQGQQASELSASTKLAREQSMEFVKAIDEGLDAASGGKWKPYLQAHAEGMRPIEEGEAMRGVVDAFQKAPLMASGAPSIGAGALTGAVGRETYQELTSSLKDLLKPENRAIVQDAINALHGIARAQAGAQAVSGARTSTDVTAALKSGLKGQAGGGIISDVVHLADVVGANRAGNMLDQALLNPKLFAKLLADAEKNPKSLAAQYLTKMVGGTARFVTRQPRRPE